MKKVFILLVLAGAADAQLNLEWGSYLTLEHPAVGDQYQLDDQFNTRFGNAMDSINDELVIGASHYDINGEENAGRIFYLRSASNGAIKPLEWVSGNGRYSQSSISGAAPEAQDLFARSVAIVATASNASKVLIGVPLEDIGSTESGMFHEMFIDSQGVDFLNYHQDTSGVQGTAEVGDDMGRSVAWGDFDNDGNWDAAIGVPGESVLGFSGAGAVNVIMGGSNGILDPGDDQIWDQSSLFIEGSPASEDQFGWVLAVGDFDDDGRSDLAIGIPFEDIGNEANAGAVQIIYGEAGEGLVSTGSLFISQAETGFLGAAEEGDWFGFSLAAGRLNGDSYDDLSIGAPLESFSDASDAGAAYIVHGSSGGLQFSDEYVISEAYFSVPGGRRGNRRFGWAQTSSDFDNDGKDDLAINAWGQFFNVSAVIVAYHINHDFIFRDGFE